MLERDYQAKLIKKIKTLFPNAIVMKSDSSYIQGIPDLTVLYGKKWAFLEVKRDTKAKKQANQPFYIQYADTNAFGRIISPENKEEVLNELQSALRSKR